MTMSLKTHTAYPEIQVDPAVDADGQTVYAWEAKIMRQPAETFEEYMTKRCAPDTVTAFRSIMIDELTTDVMRKEAMAGIIADGNAPKALLATTAVSFAGTATSRQAAIDEAVALIASVQDEYLKEVV